MDGSLQYQVELDSAQAVAAVERFNAVADKMAAKIDGIRTTSGGAESASSSLFDKIAHAGSNIANTVAGFEALNKALTWLKGAQTAAAASAKVAAAANTGLAVATTAASTGARAGAVGLGLFGGAAAGAAIGVGTLMASLGVILPIIAAASLAISGFSMTVGALAKGTGLANEFEKTSIAFKTLTGDATKASAVMSMLSQMAIDTPFSEAELQGGARALLAARVPASMLKQELKAIGNIASATNGDVGRLASVYAQVAGKGKLYAEELQQFVEQGAGELRQAVASTLGVTTSKLFEMMQAGQVGFATLQQAIQNLAGATGKWGGAMEDQSKTNLGMLSSLQDNFGKIYRLLATPIADGPLKAFLEKAVSISSQVATTMGAAISQGQVGEAMALALELGAKKGFNAFMDTLQAIKDKMVSWAYQIAGLIGKAMNGDVNGLAAMLASQIASFDPLKGRFDTSKPEAGLKRIIDLAGKAEKALGRKKADFARRLDAGEVDQTPLPKLTDSARNDLGADPKTEDRLDRLNLPMAPPKDAKSAAEMLNDPTYQPEVANSGQSGIPMPGMAAPVIAPMPGVPVVVPAPAASSSAPKPAEAAAPDTPTGPTTPTSAKDYMAGLTGTPAAAPSTASTPTTGKDYMAGLMGGPTATAPTIPTPVASPQGGGYRDNSMVAGAQVAGKAAAKIQGYSREKQGGADAARARAAGRVDAARNRVASQPFNMPSPTAPGAAVQSALTPAGPAGRNGASAGNAGGPGGGLAPVVTKLEAVVSELQRIRTE